MKASIDVLAKAEGRKIAVLGDMGELGQDTKALHYSVGEHFKGKGIEELFCAGPLSAEIARAVETCSKETKVHQFATREELEQELVPYVKLPILGDFRQLWPLYRNNRKRLPDRKFCYGNRFFMPYLYFFLTFQQ